MKTKSISYKLFVFNLLLMLLMVITDKLWEKLGLSENENIYYALTGLIIFGISIAGFIIGFYEHKLQKPKAKIGIIGNLIITLIFILLFFIVAISMKKT